MKLVLAIVLALFAFAVPAQAQGTTLPDKITLSVTCAEIENLDDPTRPGIALELTIHTPASILARCPSMPTTFVTEYIVGWYDYNVHYYWICRRIPRPGSGWEFGCEKWWDRWVNIAPCGLTETFETGLSPTAPFDDSPIGIGPDLTCEQLESCVLSKGNDAFDLWLNYLMESRLCSSILSQTCGFPMAGGTNPNYPDYCSYAGTVETYPMYTVFGTMYTAPDRPFYCEDAPVGNPYFALTMSQYRYRIAKEDFKRAFRMCVGAYRICAGDVTGDGVSDGADYIAFINSYTNADPLTDDLADVNMDGVIDGDDYTEFLNSYTTGC